jgi:hypothetical protein
MTINLGDKVKDKISGFTGIAWGRYEYLNGCVRIDVHPEKLNKDGTRIEGSVFDIEQLDLVKAAKVRVSRPGGGPRPQPSRPAVPSR